MKGIYIAFLISLLSTTVQSQVANLDWALSTGGAWQEIGYSITSDVMGNIYVTGYFAGTVDFDPSMSSFNLSSNGGDDIFVQKLDTGGNFIWARSMGGGSGEVGRSITTDILGNIYVTGVFEGIVDFDPGVDTFNLTSNGGYDIFIQKLDTGGNFIWAKSVGATSFDDGWSIVTDDWGNVYITGTFNAMVDFDPGVDTFNLTSNGSQDIFIQKLDTGGNFVWAKSIGGTLLDYSKSVVVDEWGGVYVTGHFRSTVVDFDPSGATYNLTTYNLTSNGTEDVFILKLDTGGNFIWARSMGGRLNDISYSITTDTLGFVYTTGAFHDTVDFDPSGTTFNLASNGGYDIFIHKLDTGGNFIWAKSIGAGSFDYGRCVVTDASGNVYVAGSHWGTADFDPDTSVFYLSSNGQFDAYIQKLDADGNFIWAKQMGGTSSEESFSVTVDASDNVYTIGRFDGVADFDPGIATFNITPNGNNDIFIQKLNQCTPNNVTDIVVACDSFIWIDTITYTSSNTTATYTLTNVAGCDSVVMLDLTVYNSSTGVDIQTVCNAYTWIDGNTYTSNNNSAMFNIIGGAANGCDSLVALDLTIINGTSGIDAQTACGTYDWIDGNTYTVNNNIATFNIIGGAANGCDSLVSLDLTIYDLPLVSVAGPNSICLGTGTVFQASGANSYTWSTGDTTASLSVAPLTDTSYTVVGEDTNSCISIINVDLMVKDTILVGTITQSSGSPLQNSIVYLITFSSIDSSLAAIDTTLTDTSGRYAFIFLDSLVYIKVAPDSNMYPNEMPTYYSSSLVFQMASMVNLFCDSNVIDYSTTFGINPGGLGFIGGLITQGAGKKGGIGEPVKGLSLLLIDSNSNSVLATVTDTVGYFRFPSVDYGDYDIWVDWPFVNNGLSPKISVTTAQPYRDSLKFVLHSTWLEYEADSVVGIIYPEINMNIMVHPNPSQGRINIDLGNLREVNVKVLDVTGQLIYQKRNINASTYQFEINEAEGMYFIEVSSKGKTQYYKLVIE